MSDLAKSDAARVGQVLLRLGAAYREPVSELTVEVYWEALGGTPVAYLEEVIKRWIARERFFPSPVELRQEAKEVELEDRHRRPRLAEESVVLNDEQRAEIKEMIDGLKERMGWGRPRR